VKEQVLKAELQRRLAELRLMEKITEDERFEILHREAELEKMTRVREFNIEKRKRSLQKIKRQEETLLNRNEEILKSHIKIQQELEQMAAELEDSNRHPAC